MMPLVISNLASEHMIPLESFPKKDIPTTYSYFTEAQLLIPPTKNFPFCRKILDYLKPSVYPVTAALSRRVISPDSLKYGDDKN